VGFHLTLKYHADPKTNGNTEKSKSMMANAFASEKKYNLHSE
jgi:hypothetical protein